MNVDILPLGSIDVNDSYIMKFFKIETHIAITPHKLNH